MRTSRVLLLAAGVLLSPAASARAQLSTPLDSASLSAFRWRNIGPAVMAGRVTDIEADPRDSKVFYVASAAGGIWKTVNNGTMFFPLFDKERVVSMGDIAIAPSNGDIIYAGTGEEDSRNSISPGGGLYKSTDAGKTWKLMGLEATQQIGRIVVDPQDPNIVYVCALGHAWGPNPERGLYKSTDGGVTWKLSKFISDKAGFVDVAMDPADHNTLYASSWERVRGPYFLNSGGPGSGLWKSTDAGNTWTEIKGGGFPETMKGRIGIAIAPSNSKYVYAWVEADTLKHALKKGEKADTSKAQKPISGLYRSTDAGATWTQMWKNQGDARPFYYSQVRVDPKNPDRVYWMSSVFRFSDDGGKTERRGALSIHTDWHAMWIDPKDPDHFIIGDDGGIAITWDKGGTYDFPNTFPIGQFYHVSYDMSKPYRVCGGLQDNGTWCGPSRTRNRLGSTNADWFNIGGGDGFYSAQDPNNANIVYSESQGGNAARVDLGSGARYPIMRGSGGRGVNFEDSLIVARGDTMQPINPKISAAVEAVRKRAAADSAQRYRFNWSTPFMLSQHNPSTIYMGANRVLRSLDRGDNFFPISPDLSTMDTMRIRVSTKTTGGITSDATGAETYGTITALSESPVRPGILFAGTDDGNVWMTTNDGGEWTNLTKRFPGAPVKGWVTRLETSHFDTATVYVSIDAHRDNDFRPYLYVSNDFGKTFRSIVNNLPTGGPDFVHVIREDPFNRDLLFVGTDVGAYASTNRGATWQKFMTDLPTVPVHDLRIHPRDHELIAATHGRSIWITDIAPLEQMADSVMKGSYFFQPTQAYQYALVNTQQWNGNKIFVADNPPYGATFTYRLTGGNTADSAQVVITNVKGDVVRKLTGPGGAGVHRVTWDLRGLPRPLGPAGIRDSINAARARQRVQDSIRATAGSDTTGAGRGLPGMDTTAFRAMRDSMSAMRERGDTAGVRKLRERMQAQGGGRGAGRRGQGGFGGQPGTINLRPAEAPPGPPQAFPGGGGRGGFGGFARPGSAVDEGDYLVTITANGTTMKRVVHVERVGDVGPDFGFGGDDEDDQDGGQP